MLGRRLIIAGSDATIDVKAYTKLLVRSRELADKLISPVSILHGTETRAPQGKLTATQPVFRRFTAQPKPVKRASPQQVHSQSHTRSVQHETRSTLLQEPQDRATSFASYLEFSLTYESNKTGKSTRHPKHSGMRPAGRLRCSREIQHGVTCQ